MNKLGVKDKLKNNKLPEGWTISILENVSMSIKKNAPKNSSPYLEIGDIDIKTKRYSLKDKKSPNHCLIASQKCLVISKVRPTRGAISLIGEQSLYVSPAFLVLKSTIDFEYLYFYLSRKKFFNFLCTRETGTTYPSVNDEDILEFKLMVPFFLHEQQKIAEILETVDETIEKTDAIIEKYKRIKQGLMQNLLTRGITAFEFEKDKLIASVKKVFDSGDHRFGREENLVSHLSRHLDEFFPGWNVDSEVEKNNERQRPDIIIHKRRMDENLFAIEVKKNKNLNAIKQDIEKLKDVMLWDYHYEDVVFIGFEIENSEDVFKLSEKVNFILVSKNGEIKVKPRVRRFKNSPIGRIPEEWKIVKLSNITNVMVGYVGPISEFYITNGDKIPLLSTTNVSKNGIKLESLKYVTSEFHNRNKKSQIFPCDIMIARHGLSGSAAVIPDNLKEAQCLNVIIVRHSEKFESKFIEYLFNFKFIRDILIGWKSGSVQGVVNTKILEKFKIFLPPLLEQHRIAGILFQIDETIEKEQKYKQKFEQIKQGLMEDLLTGKVRVNHLIKEGVESV